jgi:hypothetical protein
MRVRALVILLLAAMSPLPAAAQKKGAARGAKATLSPSPAATPAVTPSPVPMSASCTGAPYRQFDFWLGDWDLIGPDGKKSADDHVAAILGGCAVEENWTGARSGQGISFSAYDPATKRWHQTLMDDGGAVLNLEGEFADGKMILVGTRPSQKEKGVTITHRIAWTPQPDHRVKQVWENSTNGGRTWRLVSEGTYVPKR